MYRNPGLSLLIVLSAALHVSQAGIVADHNDTDITILSQEGMQKAKDELHIGYGHTSHGSQVTDGMLGLVDFANNGGKGLALPTDFFAWNNGGTGGALDLHDLFKPGDLGSSTWADDTRDYLDDPENADVNVIMWAWCGQADNTPEYIQNYLDTMTRLEFEYPHVNFVYMTGHLVGTGLEGNLHLRNEQIRDYCRANNKVLYDFADIETWDPDNTYFGDKYPDDFCDYDGDGEMPRTETGNWADEWQDSHTLGVDWYSCGSSHTLPLNSNQKAYAAWSLWTAIAGRRDAITGMRFHESLDQFYRPEPNGYVHETDDGPIGQEFRPTRSSLDYVDLYIEDLGCPSDGAKLYVAIHEDDITTTPLGTSGTYHIQSCFSGVGRFQFTDPVTGLIPGHRYVLELAHTENSTFGAMIREGDGAYHGGRLISGGSPRQDDDLWFTLGHSSAKWIAWNNHPDFDTEIVEYDLVRGDLRTLRETGQFTTVVDECCCDNNVAPFMDHDTDPVLTGGQDWAGFWFLARGVLNGASLHYDVADTCCDQGAGNGMQHHPRDVEVDASAYSCP